MDKVLVGEEGRDFRGKIREVQLDEVELFLDEIETLRLCDLEGLEQSGF